MSPCSRKLPRKRSTATWIHHDSARLRHAEARKSNVKTKLWAGRADKKKKKRISRGLFYLGNETVSKHTVCVNGQRQELAHFTFVERTLLR